MTNVPERFYKGKDGVVRIAKEHIHHLLKLAHAADVANDHADARVYRDEAWKIAESFLPTNEPCPTCGRS